MSFFPPDVLEALQAHRAQSQRTFPPVFGRAPPQQPLPSMGNHMVPPGLLGAPGSYNQQALQLAGLLGGPAPGGIPGQVPPLPVKGFTPGRFMPGFRAGINTPIPGGGGAPRGSFQRY